MNHSLKSILLTLIFLTSITTATTINVPDDSTTIQAALNAAQQGDTVLVKPGTYDENIFWPDVNGIKLISAGDSSNTVIDGGASGSVIYMNPSDATIDNTTEIRGFKITNGGNIGNGGGIFVSNASPLLTRLWVTGNTAWEGSGVGLYISGGSPTLTYVNVTGNTTWEGSGGGLCISGSSPTLTYVTVTGNTATGDGGGLYISGGSPTLTDVTVTGNTATDDGGGLYIQDSSPTLTGVTVTGNTATDHGGGLYILRGSPTLTDVTVTGNTASSGGGLYIQDYSPTLTGVTVTGNTAGNGGGLYIRSGSPAMVNVTITGNTSGIHVESGTPTIAASNIAYNGAGLYNAVKTEMVDADSIWWGDSSGPYHPTQNPGGLGDNVNQYVDIEPFLAEPDTAAPPIRVQNLTIDSTGYDFIGLSWDDSPIGDFAGYKVYYDTDATGFPYANTVDVGADTSYTLSGLLSGTTFYLAVTCYDTDGNESWYSEEVSATTRILDTTAPAKPTNLSATPGDRQVILTWSPNTEPDLAKYRIYRDTSSPASTLIDSVVGSPPYTSYTDTDLTNDTPYYYRIKAVDTAGNESDDFSNEDSAAPTALAVEESSGIPASFALHPAYPNPFNPTSTIRYDLPEAANITILVYDILGREISRLVAGHVEPGYHQVIWDSKDIGGREVPTGIYIARLVTPEYTHSIKLVFLK